MAAPKGISWRASNTFFMRPRRKKEVAPDEYSIEPSKMAPFLADPELLPKKPPGWKDPRA